MTGKVYQFEGEYAFLSNFYEQPIKYFEMTFQTAEHMFNALKTNDITEAYHVMSAPTPGIAKSRGRKVTLKDNWDDVERFRAMRRTLGAKFMMNPEMAHKLISTGVTYLEEGNWWHDNVWGVCNCGQWTCKGQGQNHLGKMLMELRDDLNKWM